MLCQPIGGTRNAPQEVNLTSSGMNTADMCASCKCMKCNDGPAHTQACDGCMTCEGAKVACPKFKTV